MCKKYGVNKVTSLIMVIVMLLSTLITVNADTISSSQQSGKSKVVAEIAPAVFSATVPYVLPITVDKDQNIYVADNAKIQNNANGPINVVGAEISTNNGWKFVDNSVDFKAVPVNTKQMKLKVMGSSLAPSGSVDTSLFDTISGQSSISLTYDAETAVQSEAIDSEIVASALFTVEWDELFMSKATVSKSALNTFIGTTAVSFQRTQENLNIDDVKADSKYVKIDDGATDYSIYAWLDNSKNGYWWTDAITAYLPKVSSGLFHGCTKLITLDLTGFDTSNVTNMYEMFAMCKNLTSLDISNFDTSKVTSMYAMFRGCNSLTSLDVSNFDTSAVTNMYLMFDGCASLTSLDVSNFDTSKVTIMDGLFRYCSNINSLDLSSFNTSKVTSMKELFCACNLTSLNLTSFDTSAVTNMAHMFDGCVSLTSLDVSNFDTSKVSSMSYMFSGCSSLTSLDVSNFNTSAVTNMFYMFSGCSSLTSLDLSNLDTSNVTNTQGMFSDCSSLTSLDLSNIKTSNVTDMFLMFNKCSNLKTIYVSSFNTNKVKYNDSMFYDCTSLVGGNGTTYNSSYIDKTYARIDTADTPGYFTYKAT